jgi:hypothetical protein
VLVKGKGGRTIMGRAVDSLEGGVEVVEGAMGEAADGAGDEAVVAEEAADEAVVAEETGPAVAVAEDPSARV